MIYSEKAFAKINLFLDVLSKRTDGYHEIGTVFQTVDTHDVLEAELRDDAHIELTYNISQDYPVESDLVFRAASALQKHGGISRGVHLHLHKQLPLGAGLGGGSADAAAALRLLNRLWNLQLPSQTLCDIGAKLGADVPFLIKGGTALASGIGEILTPLPAAVLPEGFVLVIATPLCAVPTKAAYAGIHPSGETRWKKFLAHCPHPINPLDPNFDLFNKFEESVLPQYPQITALRENFMHLGAHRTLMSGSGASVFSFFSSEICAKKALLTLDGTIRFGTVARFADFC